MATPALSWIPGPATNLGFSTGVSAPRTPWMTSNRPSTFTPSVGLKDFSFNPEANLTESGGILVDMFSATGFDSLLPSQSIALTGGSSQGIPTNTLIVIAAIGLLAIVFMRK